eukprot:425829-Hanusia_phi.AAC.1
MPRPIADVEVGDGVRCSIASDRLKQYKLVVKRSPLIDRDCPDSCLPVARSKSKVVHLINLEVSGRSGRKCPAVLETPDPSWVEVPFQERLGPRQSVDRDKRKLISPDVLLLKTLTALSSHPVTYTRSATCSPAAPWMPLVTIPAWLSPSVNVCSSVRPPVLWSMSKTDTEWSMKLVT